MKDSRKPKAAFICVHNSCRGQIAEALGKDLAAGVADPTGQPDKVLRKKIQEANPRR